MAARKTSGLDKVIDRLKNDLDRLIAELVDQRMRDAFTKAQGFALGKTKALSAGASAGASASAGTGKRRRVGSADAQNAVLTAIQKSGKAMGAAAIRSATGLGKAPVTSALKVLMADKAVNKVGEKRATVYFIGDAPPAGATKKAARPKKKAKKKKKKAA